MPISDYHSFDFDFDLAGISAAGKDWDTVIPQALLQDRHVGVIDAVDAACSPAHWRGRIERRDDGFFMQASLSLKIDRRCDRCLEDFEWQLDADCHRSFALGSAHKQTQESEEELDEVDYLPHPGRINLVDLLREEIWLAWRPVLVCKASCPGLCPDCGHSRNSDACHCAEAIPDDHPFAALRKLQQKT